MRNPAIFNCLQIVKYNPSPINYYELSLYQDYTDDAKESLKKAIILDPNFIDAYASLGFVSCQRNEWDAAVYYLEKGLALKPNDKLMLGNLNWALSTKNQ